MKKKSLNAKKIIHRKLLNNLNNPKIRKIYNVFSKNLTNLKSSSKLAVALSGGKDSLALAYLAKCYSVIHSNKIYFYHIDHGLRKDSLRQANQLKIKMKNYDINCKILKWRGVKPNSNIQAIARNKRYNLLKTECSKNKVKLLLLGHHIDDIYENFFIRLLRGSGLKGLISFYSNETKHEKDLRILRPLYQIKKKDLDYLASNIFNFSIEDSSNMDMNFKRIRIRKLLNNLKKEGLDNKKLNLTLINLSNSEYCINYYVNKNINSNTIRNKKNNYIINKDFLQEPFEIVFRSLSLILQRVSNSYYPPRGKNLQNLIYLLNSKKFKKATLSGCIIEKINNSLKIYKEKREI
jgi:tRNA(Ile)-lysidine synthase